MGLAAPKNRSRIGNDPNNTTWANNTARFGHKILTAQGWTPGSTLGAKDASHAAHYTAASASHIRVLLKDDTLGLGAKRGSERAENFGLAGLESVLGRLNGKVEEVKKEEERQEEIARRGFVAQKFGMMNFVSGGFLVGDRIEKGVRLRPDGEFEKSRVKKEEVEIKIEVKEEEVSSDEEKKRKKRKRSKEEDEVVVKVEEGEGQPSLKRKRKSGNLRDKAANEDEERTSKKEKKEKKQSKKDKSSATEDSSMVDTPTASEEPLSDKAKRKAEKRARKEEKKLKKALKKAAKEAARASSPKEASSSSSSGDEDTTPAVSSAPTTGTSTPVSLFGSGARHGARARYIRQKKMASMDPQALKEIFMIKTAVS
ncbi:hypothetical protein M011DRAFT_484878 [Sporormia fimetaria CBS 119925]|uniref:PinX1-related protein 1 n=1 Tax=Sporormia fimetaria CBS 119925 TaxID=1340428 RepID=A0A6A6VJS1_9PLEO|nr:hypothetical protein M011DRAFT_484878 [Sporormia fimetaria CBS 119925]